MSTRIGVKSLLRRAGVVVKPNLSARIGVESVLKGAGAVLKPSMSTRIGVKSLLKVVGAFLKPNLSARIGVKSLLRRASAFSNQTRQPGDWRTVVVGTCWRFAQTKPFSQDWGKVVVETHTDSQVSGRSKALKTNVMSVGNSSQASCLSTNSAMDDSIGDS